MTSEIAKVMKGLPKRFVKGNVRKPRTFYFSLGDKEKWTVALGQDECEVTAGKPEEDVDCFFKASEEMFLEVWNGPRPRSNVRRAKPSRSCAPRWPTSRSKPRARS